MVDYSPLQAWLYSADENFIAGRALGMTTVFLTQSCGSTWLGFEQMIKTLLLQDLIGNSEQVYTADELGDKAKSYGHKIDRLLTSLDGVHPQSITGLHKDRLQQIFDFYWHRYPLHNSDSINLNRAPLDELYFRLRDFVKHEVGLGLVERIYIRKQTQQIQEKGDDFAFIGNPYFRPRPFAQHDVFNPISGRVETIKGYPETS